MNGLDALCAGLRRHGVEVVFGLPGTQNAEFFNKLPETLVPHGATVTVPSWSPHHRAALWCCAFCVRPP